MMKDTRIIKAQILEIINRIDSEALLVRLYNLLKVFEQTYRG